jgi:FMN hydrolase / 5-amino-6-(5-phospho-D-ribitylamino)uracil phosphatase
VQDSILSQLSRIRAISFDGDMTLWDFDKVMRRSLAYALAELRTARPGEASAKLTIDKMIEIRNAVSEELKGLAAGLEQVRLAAFIRTVAEVGEASDQLAKHLNAVYLKHRFEDVELYPDVEPTLEAIAGRYVLGLVSNGNTYPERCGLQTRFEFVVFSEEIGVEKPDPAIFRVACVKAGCSPTELMHVGDSLTSDVHGAKLVGAVSVWLNRDWARRQAGPCPDFEIHALTELPLILESHGNRFY